jgi:putative glutamine amidotransferase
MAVVGITPCRKLPDYEAAVTRAGARAVVLDLAQPTEISMAGIDGLVLTGGGDVDPLLYGQEPHPTFSPDDAGRDEAEIALARAALAARMPMLAICRGVQVLNVAAGGSLVQDIPSAIPQALDHGVETSPSAIAHDVWVTAGSQLAQLLAERLDGDTLAVNSRHHQAVQDVAPGFVVGATAPDGVIEAIEAPAQPFCVGVQWHPENFWRTGEFRALFEGLVAATHAPR